MFFVIVGVLMMLSNLAGIGPLAAWNWELTGDLYKFCIPFGMAALWWMWTDMSGMDKRREIEKMDERKRRRREENLVSLGLDNKANRKANRR
jgi:small Trp-rich protein